MSGTIFFLLVVFIIIILPGIAVFILWKKYLGKKNNKNFLKGSTVVPQYAPPEGLNAAELGVLVDQKGGRLEFLATIYQLKTRKILALSRGEDQTLTMVLLQYHKEQLASYEDMLLRYFFHETKQITLNSFFGRTDFAIAQAYFQYLVMQNLQSRKLLFIEEGYDTQPYTTYLEKVAANPLKYALDYVKNGIRKNLTPQAIQMYPNIEGFKEYIETAELDKIKFHAVGSLEEYIELLTPYAIALNQMERWRLVGIPLFTIQVELSKQAEYQPQTADPAAVYEEVLAVVNALDAYAIPA